MSILAQPWLSSSASAQPAAPPATQPRPMVFDQTLQQGDRLLFVGDEMTQQMFYTRGVATALMALRPQWHLRIYNGGYEGATTASAMQWIDDLLTLTRPTVVFIALGLNEAASPAESGAHAAGFERQLAKLVERVRKEPTVRRVIVVSPPPLDRADDTADKPGLENQVLLQLAQAAERVALEHQAGFINIFSYTRQIYVDARRSEGEPLVIGARLPSELGHMVIASEVLVGLGVTPAMLEPVGWSPLLPRQMRRVRHALAISMKAPKAPAAQRSRDLYESMQGFDEGFFRLWRLSGKHPSAPSRQTAASQVEEAWSKVEAVAQNYRSDGGG